MMTEDGDVFGDGDDVGDGDGNLTGYSVILGWPSCGSVDGSGYRYCSPYNGTRGRGYRFDMHGHTVDDNGWDAREVFW